jgi:hypothetical protein
VCAGRRAGLRRLPGPRALPGPGRHRRQWPRRGSRHLRRHQAPRAHPAARQPPVQHRQRLVAGSCPGRAGSPPGRPGGPAAGRRPARHPRLHAAQGLGAVGPWLPGPAALLAVCAGAGAGGAGVSAGRTAGQRQGRRPGAWQQPAGAGGGLAAVRPRHARHRPPHPAGPGAAAGRPARPGVCGAQPAPGRPAGAPGPAGCPPVHWYPSTGVHGCPAVVSAVGLAVSTLDGLWWRPSTGHRR